MSRPETIDDIEVDTISFGTVELGLIATNGAMVKAYGAFMEAVQKAGATVEVQYGHTAKFIREPTESELMEQLRSKQNIWDEGKKCYETLRDVGECEYSYQSGQAQRWAEKEGLPFPPESHEIKSYDAVIRDIEEAVDA